MDRLDLLASSARIVANSWGKPSLAKHSQPHRTYELSDELLSYDFTDIVSSGTGTDEDCLPFVATPLLVASPEPTFPFPLLLPINSVQPPPTPIPAPPQPKPPPPQVRKEKKPPKTRPWVFGVKEPDGSWVNGRKVRKPPQPK